MYHIRPLSVVPDNIDLPKCMYHMKPLNGIQLESLETPVIKRVKMDPGLQAIEEKQLTVIAKLRQLRDTVDGLISKAGDVTGAIQQSKCSLVSSAIKSLCSTTTTIQQFPIVDTTAPDDLVIEASPNRPPLSLLFLRNLLPTIRTLSHTHSSCTLPVDQKLVSLFNRDIAATPSTTIRVVWKNGPSSRLTPPTLGSCGVEGEANVARYLSRVLSKPGDTALNYDALSLEQLVLVDGVLESSGLVDTAPEQFLNSLQAYVQSKSGGSSGGRTIADFVGYSTLRYLTKQQPSRSIQKSLIDWMNGLTNEVPLLS